MNDASHLPAAQGPPAPVFTYQITKYDPADRDEHGAYIGGEDVLSDHGKVEAAYLEAITAFAADAGVTTLSVREPGIAGFVNFGVEPTIDGNGLRGLFPGGIEDFHDGAVVSLHVARELVRVMLRDNGAWCRLEADDQFTIHIGYDQYLYIGTSTPSDNAQAAIRELGLFVQRISASPYAWAPDDPPYPPADPAFWTDVASIMAESGSLLLEATAVRNGSRWHRLFPGNIDSVRAGLLPRSVLQLWPNLSTNIPGILALLKGDLVQVVWEDSTGKISSEWFDPDSFADARAELATARAATVMSAYVDDSHPLLSAVLPDADGVVRARWSQ